MKATHRQPSPNGQRHEGGWTLETTARRLADVGCPLHSSAVFKIERGQRRIGVDELVAFSKILDISVDELLSPVELVLDARATELVTAWGQTRANLVHVAQPAEERAASAVRDYYCSVEIPSIQGAIESLVNATLSGQGEPNPTAETRRVLGTTRRKA